VQKRQPELEEIHPCHYTHWQQDGQPTAGHIAQDEPQVCRLGQRPFCVKTVVIGDVEGVQKNTSRRKKNNNVQKRRSRSLNQKLSQWPFGLLQAYLTYKLAALGVDLIKIDESYTTQTCPVCGRKKKPSGRIYQCHCGYTCHRDVHGAKNIYAKFKYGEIRTLNWSVEKITYLRPAS